MLLVVRLLGGIGNQLFQYACGYSLAQKYGFDLCLDTREYAHYPNRQYDLGIYGNQNIVSGSDLDQYFFPSPSGINRLVYLVKKSFSKTNYALITENDFGFDPSILAIKPSTHYYLSGYWQSFRYFEGYEADLRSFFTLKLPLEGLNRDYMAQILASESVSLHIRRGDYASDPQIASVHGACSPSYYKQATEKMTSRIPEAHFFIFSDDIAWCKQNFFLEKTSFTYVDIAQNPNYADLRLMAACRHQIIANSSFSWWGAWLNANSEKVVIAPQAWFLGKKVSTKDLIPASWLQLPNFD